ncbi:ABC transporter ATP-binding protein, partial [Candidatus Margulisiibacteriota bacterium]
ICLLIKLSLILILCFSINKPLTLFALISIPLHFIQTQFFSKKLKEIKKENRGKNATIFDMLEERLANIKFVKLFHKYTMEVSKLLKQVSVLFVIERKAKIALAIHNLFSTVINRSWVLALGLYTGYIMISGQLTFGEVIAISTFFAMLISPVENITTLYKRFAYSKPSFQRIADILDYPGEKLEDETRGETVDLNGKIVFKNVSFGYEKDNVLLKDLSFEVNPGSSLAIIGRSGIGKSSIIDLLLRFYPLTGGQILLDNKNIENICISSLRSQIAVISDDACLFKGTIRENIIFGYEGRCTKEDIIEAAKKADAHNFIMSLPRGYDTEVGIKGIKLTYQGRLYVSIARALLRNPKILIFDTGGQRMDIKSEAQIQSALAKLSGKITFIFITNRLSLLTNYDNVIVLDMNGQIAEQGHPEKLLQEKSILYKLHELQYGGFQNFVRHINFLINSVKHAKRPFSVAMFKLMNYDLIYQSIKSSKIHSFIDDLGIIISLLLRNIDECNYESNGKFWISFPETKLEEAEKACEKLKDYIEKIEHKDLEGMKLHFCWSVVQGEMQDSINSLESKLEKELQIKCKKD